MVDKPSIYSQNLTRDEFESLKNFIEGHCGIKMPEKKIEMLQGRLRKRVIALSFDSYSDYLNFVFNTPDGEAEIVNLIDVVTTNKTDFFREPQHFDFLKKDFLDNVFMRFDISSSNPLKIYSAACSTGQEPYSILITLFEARDKYPRLSKFYVYASDISTQVLKKAKEGVYNAETIKDIPLEMKRKYFLKSGDKEANLVKVKDFLKERIFFKRLNFMDSNYNISEKFHGIFCRNALIYFSKENQYEIIRKLIKNLLPGGFFFLGHSETILDNSLPLKKVSNSVFQKI